MKPFLLFSGEFYYPRGGWDDFQGSFDSFDEAKTALDSGGEWAQIVDMNNGNVFSATRTRGPWDSWTAWEWTTDKETK